MSLTQDWLMAGPVEPCFDPDRLRSALGALDTMEIDGLVKGSAGPVADLAGRHRRAGLESPVRRSAVSRGHSQAIRCRA
jgi:hypothetical protein